MDYYTSRYCHIFKHPTNAKYVAYNALTQAKVFIDRKTAVLLEESCLNKSVNNPFIPSLIESNMVIPSLEADEENRNNLIEKLKIKKPTCGILYLILSTDCNLRCTYCSVEKAENEISKPVMSPEVAGHAIDWFIKHFKTDETTPKLIFYGGEPLIGRDAFVHAVTIWRKYLEGENTSSDITLITNGVLLDEALIDFIDYSNVNLSLSIDGPKEIHDQSRIFPGGEGSFEKSWEAFNKCQDKGLKPSISCTLSEHSLKNMESLLKWLSEVVRPEGLGFNVIRCRSDLELDDAYYNECSNAIYNAFKVLREIPIYEDRALRKVNSFFQPSFHSTDCAGLGNQLTIDPNGNIGICHIATCNNNLLTGKNIYSSNDTKSINNLIGYLKQWASYAPLLDDKCQDCPALAICGGGCLYHVLLSGKTNKERDQTFCNDAIFWINKLLHEFMGN